MVYSYFYSGIRGFPPPACAGSPQPRDLIAAGLARESAAGVLRAAYTCGEAASWGAGPQMQLAPQQRGALSSALGNQ